MPMGTNHSCRELCIDCVISDMPTEKCATVHSNCGGEAFGSRLGEPDASGSSCFRTDNPAAVIFRAMFSRVFALSARGCPRACPTSTVAEIEIAAVSR